MLKPLLGSSKKLLLAYKEARERKDEMRSKRGYVAKKNLFENAQLEEELVIRNGRKMKLIAIGEGTNATERRTTIDSSRMFGKVKSEDDGALKPSEARDPGSYTTNSC